MIITRTPLRVSLIGGGTDLPAFYSHHIGRVVSFCINKYVYVALNKKFDGKLRVSYSKTENVTGIDELDHELVRETLREWKVFSGVEIVSIADIPGGGTGLGSSSAFTVGLIHALGKSNHPSIIAERAYIIEAEICHRPVGKQDHYSCARGGMNYITFHKNRVEVETLYPHNDMEENLLLLYTGITRSSNDILKEQGNNFKKGNTIETGKKLSELAYRFRNDWLDGRMTYEKMGNYLHSGWELKKKLSSVSNEQIDAWYKIAMKNGALGGKLLGAGGGGFLLFVAPFETHARISEATGLRRIDFKLENSGSEIIYNG